MPEFDRANKMGSESSESGQLSNEHIGLLDWKKLPGAKLLFLGFLKQQHTPLGSWTDRGVVRMWALELAELEGCLGSVIDLSEPRFPLLCKMGILDSISVNPNGDRMCKHLICAWLMQGTQRFLYSMLGTKLGSFKLIF